MLFNKRSPNIAQPPLSTLHPVMVAWRQETRMDKMKDKIHRVTRQTCLPHPRAKWVMQWTLHLPKGILWRYICFCSPYFGWWKNKVRQWICQCVYIHIWFCTNKTKPIFHMNWYRMSWIDSSDLEEIVLCRVYCGSWYAPAQSYEQDLG